MRANIGFKIISVADLIAYRQRRERLVEQTSQFDVETAIGKARGFAYVTPFDQVKQLALVFGDVSSGKNVPVRLHRENVLEDVFGTAHDADQGVRDLQARGGRHPRLSAGGSGRRSGRANWRRRNPAAPSNANRPGAMSVLAPRSCAISMSARSG